MIDCEDCKAFIYDLQTGQRKTAAVGPDRVEQPLRRPPGTPLQCGVCPKKSPQHAKTVELTAKNWKTYRMWREVKATHGRCLTNTMARDAIVRRNLAAIDSIYETLERNDQRHLIAALTVRGAASGSKR